MSKSLAITSPVSYTDNQLPYTEAKYTPMISDTWFDFSADSLQLNSLVESWESMISNHRMEYTGGATQRPVVMDDGNRRYINFDGSNDRLDTSHLMYGPVLLIFVVRYPSLGGYPISSGTSTDAWLMGTYGDASKYSFAATSPMNPGDMVPDSNWHVHMIQVNGASSSYKLDGNAPNPGTVSLDPLVNTRLGATAGTYKPLNIARYALINDVVSPEKQEIISKQLRDHYRI